MKSYLYLRTELLPQAPNGRRSFSHPEQRRAYACVYHYKAIALVSRQVENIDCGAAGGCMPAQDGSLFSLTGWT